MPADGGQPGQVSANAPAPGPGSVPGMTEQTPALAATEPETAPQSRPFLLAHFSDTHVGRTQYPVVSPVSGRNQREQDMLRAFAQAVEDIHAWDPPLVIHSGDVGDKSLLSYRLQLAIQNAFQRLSRRRDGTPRLNVVISGNHDQPRDPREPCYLEPALRPLKSVIVVTNRYEQVDVSPYIERGEAPEELRDVVLHCLPHDALKRDDWSDVTPVAGKVNILISHGVVGGSELYKRCHGREYSIPIEVLTRGWDYVAMGHFHKPGPVCVGGFKEDTTPIWYAGSTENCGFSDLRDGVGGRGYLQVQVAKGQVPKVTKKDLPIRAMFRLPAIDATGLDYEQLTDKLLENIRAADLAGAVVDQKVLGVSRDTWSLVDIGLARKVASDALWYQVTPIFAEAEAGTEEENREKLGDLGVVLTETIAALVPQGDQPEVTALARKLLGSALSSLPGEEEGGGQEQPADPAPTEAAVA